MTLPNKQQILEEATRLFFFDNRIDNYNMPEREELQEAGFLVEARNNLMRTRPSWTRPLDRVVCNSARYILKIKEVKGMDWVEEWKKKDPYFQDVEGFTKFVEQKEKELHVSATVATSIGYGSPGYNILLELPYDELPEEHRKQPDAEEERRVYKLTEDLGNALKEIGYHHTKTWSRLFNADQPEPECKEGKLTHGSTTVFQYYPFEIPTTSDREIETIEDLERYVRSRMHMCSVFSSEEQSTTETTYRYEEGKQVEKKKIPTLASRIVKTAWMQPNKQEYADRLIDSEVKVRLAPFEEGCWYYFGDEAHSDRIGHNAEIMCKIWKTVGKLLRNCYLIHKDYDARSIYLGLKPETERIRLPPFSISRWDIQRILHDAFNYGHTIHKIEMPETSEPYWQGIQVLAKALLQADIPNTEDPFEDDYVWYWPEGEALPVISLYKETVPEVIEFLAAGRMSWEPEYEESIMRSGGLELLHPFLRKSRTLVWDQAVWNEDAEWTRRTYHEKFTREALEQHLVAELTLICQAKNLSVVRRKPDMIDAILEANFKEVD